MAINRYNLPAQQPLINTYAPMPFKELLLAGQSMQKQKDDLEAQRLDLAGKEFDFLSQDFDKAKEAQDWINTESEKIAGLYGTDLRGAKQALTQFQLDAKKRFGKFGDIGAMQNSYNTFQAWDQAAKKKLEKGDITQDQYAKVKAGLLSNYGGIGEGGPQGYNPFGTEEVANYYDFADFANTYGKDFEAKLQEMAWAKTNGTYINEGKNAYEVLTPKEIEIVLNQFAAGDDQLQNYLTQGMKYGYTSPEALQSAITGASYKYDVEKIMQDRGLKGDPHYQYNQEQLKEMEANSPLFIPTNQEQVNDKLTEIANAVANDSWMGEGVQGTELLEVASKEQLRALEKVNQKISDLDPSGSFENTASEGSDLYSLYQQKAELEQEINKYDALKEGFIKNAYGVDNETLNQLGFNSLDKFQNEVNSFQNDSKQVQNAIEADKQLLDETRAGISEFNGNSIVGIYFDENGKAYAEERNTKYNGNTIANQFSKTEWNNYVRNYIQDAEAYAKEYNEQVEYFNNRADNLSNNLLTQHPEISQLVDEQGAGAVNNLVTKFNNAQKVADQNANYYINNRTVTSPLVMLSPEQVKASGIYTQLEDYINTDDVQFTYKDESGKDVKYNKKAFESIKTGDNFKISNKDNRVNFAGFKLDMQDNKVKIIGITEDGKRVESDMSLNETNILAPLHKQAAYNLQTSVPGSKEYGDNLVLFAASSEDPKMKNTYKTTVDQLQALPVGITSGDDSERLYSKPIPVAGGSSILISKDNTEEMSGQVYNIYAPGITQDMIESGYLERNGKGYNSNGDLVDENGNILYIRASYDEVLPSIITSSGYIGN